MNSKLFKKLNEQVEINSIKRAPITEEEKAEIEKNLIFEDFVNETDELVNFKHQ